MHQRAVRARHHGRLEFITRSKWRIGIAIGLIALAFGLFLAQDKLDLHIESPVAATDAAFAPYLALHLNAPITKGNVFQVLENGDQLLPAMLDAIQHAKT